MKDFDPKESKAPVPDGVTSLLPPTQRFRGGDSEADVPRLLGEANSKLDGAESRRRSSAISHLKAAVAATFADRRLKATTGNGQPASPDALGRYQQDLSKAVGSVGNAPIPPAARAGDTALMGCSVLVAIPMNCCWSPPSSGANPRPATSLRPW